MNKAGEVFCVVILTHKESGMRDICKLKNNQGVAAIDKQNLRITINSYTELFTNKCQQTLNVQKHLRKKISKNQKIFQKQL